jgi:hypothetical protein
MNTEDCTSMASTRGALGAFDQHLDGAVGQLEHLQDICQAADAVEVLRFRLVLGRRFLGQQQDVLAAFHGHFEGLDRFRAADEERDDHVRKTTTSRSGSSGSSTVSGSVLGFDITMPLK